MEIISNKAVLFKTRNPEKFSIIPRHKIVEEYEGGGAAVAVYWGVDEMRVLRNLGVKKAPSPIIGRYDWPGRFKPAKHQIETAAFDVLHFASPLRARQSHKQERYRVYRFRLST